MNMKQFFLVMSVISIFIFVTSCENTEMHEARQARQIRNEAIKKATSLVRKVTYIKDPRTNLCFAYAGEYGDNRSRVLANVPCEAVPPSMLIAAIIE